MFKLKLAATVNECNAKVVKNFIQSKYLGANLIEEHTTQLHFEIAADQIRLSELFGTLCESRENLPVEGFAISQTTLEHVFVNMAKMQEMLHSGYLMVPVAAQPIAPQQVVLAQRPGYPGDSQAFSYANPSYSEAAPV